MTTIKTKVIQIRVSPAQRERWEQAAADRGLQLVEFIRASVDIQIMRDAEEKYRAAPPKEGRLKP